MNCVRITLNVNSAKNLTRSLSRREKR